MWSQTCEYALRAVTHLGRCGRDQPVLARDIADTMNIPHQYLQKVLRELVRYDVLTSTRGIGGGFQLNRPAEKLSLADVIEPFDDIKRRSTCPFGRPDCGKKNPCPVHERWSGVMTAYRDFLETTTVADLVVDPAANSSGKRGKRKRNP